MKSPFGDYTAYFGDLHNHCGVSYAHGSLSDALRNAREQLDFVSVTGHAHWPDMPEPDERIQYIIDFHKEGFAKLKKGWPDYLRGVARYNKEGEFIVYPGFEIHFNSVGDRTIMYKGLKGEILYADYIEHLEEWLRQLRLKGQDAMSFPHHIGYRKGTRGIDWDSFNPEFSPVMELISMHGCSEGSENTRPFLHSMGGSDWESTIQYGLSKGNVFGFLGNTDHHSAHPGSYGHGVSGVWATDLTREAIWDALYQRRTYALTGDRMDLKFSLNGSPMGSVLKPVHRRTCSVSLKAGGAIDCVDIVKNNRLVKRFSSTDIAPAKPSPWIHSLLYLELGWGERNKEVKWNAKIDIEGGTIKRVEPRFRGLEVVSPVEGDDSKSVSYYRSKCLQNDDQSVSIKTITTSNPNNSTNCSQGVCLELMTRKSGVVKLRLNGKKFEFSVKQLLEGARTGHLGNIDSPAFRIHRMPVKHEWQWDVSFKDTKETEQDQYYVRVRQKNDQWAWSSPVFIRQETEA